MGSVSDAIDRSIEQVRENPVVKELSDRHEYAIALKAIGLTNNEICERLGFEPAYLSRVFKDPKAISRLETYKKNLIEKTVDVAQKLQESADEALDTVVHWMRKRDDSLAAVSVRSAFGILDRAGYSKIEKHIHGHMQMSSEQIAGMQGLAHAANKAQEAFDYGRDVTGLIENDTTGAEPEGGDQEES
jgi:hypothetical protein